jgi:transposase
VILPIQLNRPRDDLFQAPQLPLGPGDTDHARQRPEMAVTWSLGHRDLDGIEAIGVDEVQWRKGHRYLTLVYQIDGNGRRLLHIAPERTVRAC